MIVKHKYIKRLFGFILLLHSEAMKLIIDEVNIVILNYDSGYYQIVNNT